MASPEQINKALDVAQFQGTLKCPAHLVDLLAEIHVPAKRGKPVKLTHTEARSLRSYIVNTFALCPDFDTDPFLRLPVDGDRIDLARLVGNEKISRAPVDVDIYPGKIARYRDGKAVGISEDEVLAENPSGIILVENMAVFRNMDRLSFEMPDEYADYMILFRGSPNKSQKICESAIRRAGCPVVVFPDFDPAGLVNAMAVPGMTSILWPGPVGLTAALRGYASSEQKFLLQMPAARAKLQAAEHPDVQAIWWIIDAYGRVPSQEAFIRPRICEN